MSEIILLTCISLSIIMLIYYVNCCIDANYSLIHILLLFLFTNKMLLRQWICNSYFNCWQFVNLKSIWNISYNSLLILDTIFRCILIAITTYQHISFGSITGHLKNLIIPLLEYLILLKIQLSERMSLWYWRWLIINEVSN